MGSDPTTYYRCPACQGELTKSSEGLWCSNCDRDYSVEENFVDFLTEDPPSKTPIAQSLFELVPPIYENIYFPALYRLGTLPDTYTPEDQALELVERTAAQESTVLDLACGTGRLTRRLAEVNRRVFALDRSRGMLGQAVKSTPHSLSDSIEYCRGDAVELPFENGTFHALTCSGAFYFFPDLQVVLNEINRVLKPGSHLAGMTVVKEGLLGNQLANWFLSLYDRVGTYRVHEIQQLAKILSETGFEEFDYERHGAILVFDAKKTSGSDN